MADQTQPKAVDTKQLRVEDTVWVLCTSPVTLLVPTTPPTGNKDADATRPQVPLKLERGVNVLAGAVLNEAGKQQYVTLDGLSSDLQQQTPETRGPAVLKLFEEAKKLYAPMFRRVGGVAPRITAIGTIRELSNGEHLGALISGAQNGTHKASLEALINLPANLVPDHIKDLARTRLAAWRPAA